MSAERNWTPFIPENTGTFGSFGYSGILRGASVVFFAYIGFDAVSTAAQEAKLPQRDMPIGILGSLVICTILYVLMALVMTGMVPYQKLGVADPVAVAIDATGIGWLSVLVKFAALAGLTTVIFVLLFGQARILFSIAQDRLLPAFFSEVHPRFRTPFASQALIGVVVAADRRQLPDRAAGGDGQHRHAVRLPAGLRRGHPPAPQRAADQASVPHAGGSLGSAVRHRLSRCC